MTWRPSFPKELQILIRLTTEQFSTLPQSILNEPWPRENACASRSCLDMASFLTYRVLAGTANGTVDCVHRQCFLEVFLSPCCDFHYSSIPVCDAVPSKGPKITGIQYGFPALTLRTEIVPDSLNLWMILCTVDDDNFKLFAIFL